MRLRKASRSSKKLMTGRPKKVSAPLRQSGEITAARNVAPLLERVVAILEEARSRVVRTVNSTMVLAYWHVGREIVEFVQRGAKRAEYGEQVLEVLSARLQERVGRGYSVRNLRYFRSFYQAYADREPLIRDSRGEFGTGLVPNSGVLGTGRLRVRRHHRINLAKIRHAPRAEFGGMLMGFSNRLSWTHYRTLLAVEDVRARSFYEVEAEREGWPVPHLERQIHTHLFARLLKSRDKDGVLDLARRGQTVERPIDLMKSPVVLDFLDLPESELLRERDLEQAVPVPPRARQRLRVCRTAEAADLRGRGVLRRPGVLQHHPQVLPAD
jgi:hypothetical protein